MAGRLEVRLLRMALASGKRRGTAARFPLREKIAALFEASDGTYGYRRMTRELGRAGVVAGEELARGLMRGLGLVSCQPRPWRQTTEQGACGPIPDLVNRDFSSGARGRRWSGTLPISRRGRAGYSWLPS